MQKQRLENNGMSRNMRRQHPTQCSSAFLAGLLFSCTKAREIDNTDDFVNE